VGERFGSAMVVLGFATHQGTYTAYGPEGLATRVARPAPAGSVESILRAARIPALILDLRRLPAGSGAERWFGAERPFRSIGAMVDTNGFHPATVARHYDALVYFDSTSHSRLLAGR
jgi:erythromycin esterase-like protein